MFKKIAFVLLLIGILFAVGCAKRAPVACTPGTPGVERMTIHFVCPVVGASYETEVYKCAGDKHFRMDIICKLCGRRHSYAVRYWPTDYWTTDYYFYGGWFYPRQYWVRYWPYSGPQYIGPPYIYPPIPAEQRQVNPPRGTPRPPREFPSPRPVQPPPPARRLGSPPPQQMGQPAPPPRTQTPVRKQQ